MNVYRKVSRSAVTWLCAALLAASGHAWAEDWWVVHKGDDPAELDVFLADADSLAPVPGIENAWQVQIAMLFDSFHLLSAHQYRCDTREVKVVNAKTFSNNGQPTDLQFTFAKGWTPLPNESHEAVLQFICAPQQRERNGMRSTGRGVPLQAAWSRWSAPRPISPRPGASSKRPRAIASWANSIVCSATSPGSPEPL